MNKRDEGREGEEDEEGVVNMRLKGEEEMFEYQWKQCTNMCMLKDTGRRYQKHGTGKWMINIPGEWLAPNRNSSFIISTNK
jgi:hypothetical protein